MIFTGSICRAKCTLNSLAMNVTMNSFQRVPNAALRVLVGPCAENWRQLCSNNLSRIARIIAQKIFRLRISSANFSRTLNNAIISVWNRSVQCDLFNRITGDICYVLNNLANLNNFVSFCKFQLNETKCNHHKSSSPCTKVYYKGVSRTRSYCY